MAACTCCAETELSAFTVADSVARFTLAWVTPGKALSAFSTRPAQEAQVMPVMPTRIGCGAVGNF